MSNDDTKIKIYPMPSRIRVTEKNGEKCTLLLCAPDRRKIKNFVVLMVKEHLKIEEESNGMDRRKARLLIKLGLYLFENANKTLEGLKIQSLNEIKTFEKKLKKT